ncbi:MAG: hypothetical protein LBI80_00785, partial [Endomicrobium sp.]|nr:hypothetical protein [Endomicrobium sp.]
VLSCLVLSCLVLSCLVLSCLVLTPNSLLAQRIDINIPTDYDVAGNGRSDPLNPNYVRISHNIANHNAYQNYYTPSTYEGNDNSNDNNIVLHLLVRSTE